MNRLFAPLKTPTWPLKALWMSVALTITAQYLMPPPLFADVIIVDSYKHNNSMQIANGISTNCPACGTIKYMDMHRDPYIGREIIKDLQSRRENGTLDLVIALGQHAATLIADELPDTPALFTVNDEPDDGLANNSQLTFFDARPPLPLQLATLATLKPDIRTVGIIARRETLASARQSIMDAAQAQQINLRIYYVDTPSGVSAGLRQAIEETDGLIFIEDTMVLNSDTVRYILRLTLENGIPTFAYSSSLVNMGMTVTLRADPKKLGGRIGAASQARLTGKPTVGAAAREDIFVLEVNERTLRHIPGARAPTGREVVFR